MKKTMPWWLTLIVVIETLPMFLGPMVAVFFPASMPWAAPGEEASAYAFIYTARNLAVGFAFIIAFALQSLPMIFILIFIRLFTDLIDLQTILYFAEVSNLPRLLSIFIFLYYIPALIALRYLWKHMKEEKRPE